MGSYNRPQVRRRAPPKSSVSTPNQKQTSGKSYISWSKVLGLILTAVVITLFFAARSQKISFNSSEVTADILAKIRGKFGGSTETISSSGLEEEEDEKPGIKVTEKFTDDEEKSTQGELNPEPVKGPEVETDSGKSVSEPEVVKESSDSSATSVSTSETELRTEPNRDSSSGSSVETEDTDEKPNSSVVSEAVPKKTELRSERPKKEGPNPTWNPLKSNFRVKPHYLKKGKLAVSIVKEDLVPVRLDHLRFGKETKLPDVGYPIEATPGAPCPTFEYSYDEMPAVASCYVDSPKIEDETVRKMKMPSNCRRKDEGCVQKGDMRNHERWTAQILLLHNVYVNVAGQIFNATHHFDVNMCATEQAFYHPEQKTRVLHYKDLVSVVDWYAWNAKYNFVDLLPLWVSLQPLLGNWDQKKSLQSIPVAFGHRLTHRRNQMEQMLAQSSHPFVLGFDLSRLNAKILSGTDLFFAENLFVPLHQHCDKPSPALWRHIRENFFLQREGFPMFTDFYSIPSGRGPHNLISFDSIKDWVVVVGMKDERRPLIETIRLMTEIHKHFPPERIVLYKEGSLSYDKRRELFSRAKLFIGLNDNLLADMVFMPKGAFVFEIRPAEVEDSSFHRLAEACELQYFLSFCDGRRAGAGGRKSSVGPAGYRMEVEAKRKMFKTLRKIVKVLQESIPVAAEGGGGSTSSE